MPTVSSKIKRFVSRRIPQQKGQSIIILAFAFMGLIAMLGLALDLGLVYIERTRIKRAVDAATLAAVVELPNEEKAYLRAIGYLDQNGYRLRNPAGQPQVNVYVRGCAHDGYLREANFKNYHDTTTAPIRATKLVSDTSGTQNILYHLYFPSTGNPVADPVGEFYIDTRSYQSKVSGVYSPDIEQCNPGADILGTANKIFINGDIPVGMNFMQFFGFGEVPVSDEAIAQNVTNLDVAVVFDMSGSMQFDTNCFGCYEPYGEGTIDWDDLPTHDPNFSIQYPNPAYLHPIPTDHLPKGTMTAGSGGIGNNTGQLCWQRDSNTVEYYTIGGSGDARRYVVIEAELYSLNTSLLAGFYRQPGRGYWAVQHTNWRTVDRMMGSGSTAVGAMPILSSYSRGSWVSHHPYVSWSLSPDPPTFLGVPFGHDYTLDEARNKPNDVPSLEYDFVTASDWETSTTNDDTRIWARVQAGYTYWAEGDRIIYWAVYEYEDLYTAAGGDPTLATPLGSGQIEKSRTDQKAYSGAAYGGADADDWRWTELTSTSTKLNLENGKRYTLKIWAGQTGYDIDQIVIGNRNDTSFTGNYNSGSTNLQATRGSAFRQACNRCNPIYGLTVDQADCVHPIDNGASTVKHDDYDQSDPNNNPLFSGYQPIRGAKESLKRFISKLDPQFDQVGIVSYSTSTPSAGRTELRCRRYLPASQCFMGTNPISFTEVLETVEMLPPNGSTNMAEGMMRGLEMLGIDPPDGLGGALDNTCQDPTDHCSRGGAARRILIVMTDGIANLDPGGVCDDNNSAYYTLWPPDTYSSDSEAQATDCAMFYAKVAAENNVTIYTIGLGNGVDVEFLEAIATLPGSNGQYFGALSPAQLDGIFDTILKSVSVRLIQ
ncbi:MAG: VWA domain-containing protein [Anaerolineae bacterium]|nr:VWA domain-containing protein [Anaerolineae bacterium]